MTIEGRPVLSDKTYKKYVLEHLENWVLDAIGTEEVTAQEVYDVFIKAISENVEHNRKELDKNSELLSLLKGHRPVDLGDEPYPGWDVWDTSVGVSSLTGPDSKEPIAFGSNKDWHDFWESYGTNYTEEEMNAMCDAAANKEKCREYNLREAEYYNKRAELDAEHERQQQCSCDY